MVDIAVKAFHSTKRCKAIALCSAMHQCPPAQWDLQSLLPSNQWACGGWDWGKVLLGSGGASGADCSDDDWADESEGFRSTRGSEGLAHAECPVSAGLCPFSLTLGWVFPLRDLFKDRPGPLEGKLNYVSKTDLSGFYFIYKKSSYSHTLYN